MKKFLLFMFAFLCSVGMWADNIVIDLDLKDISTYPTGFPTSSSDSETPKSVEWGGYTFTINATSATKPYFAGTSPDGYLMFGKCTSTQKISIDMPSISGYKLTSVEMGTTSGGSTNVYVTVNDNSNVVTGGESKQYATSTTLSWNLTSTTANKSYSLVFVGNNNSGRNVQVASLKLTYEAASANPYTVTFNAGTNGTCSTTSLTEASGGAGITLPSCTANAGYKFLGWTATEGKTTIDTGLTAGATYKPSANTTLYAVYGALYQVTIEDPTNGTLAVTCEGKDVTSGEYYAVGEVLNIEATPADGYKFRNIQVVDGSTHTFTASNTKDWTMGTSSITIKANFDEIIYRTITWSVNGNTSTIAPTQVENGTNITFPTGLADIYGKKFMGWSTNSAASTAGDIVSGDVAASADVTYYAVYANVTPGVQETATLTITDTQSTGYTENLTRTDDQGNDWVSYACIALQTSNKVNYPVIQINKSSNGYYIGSPDFGSNVKAISAKAWNTGSSARSAYLKANTQTKQPSTSDYGTTEIAGNSKGVDIDFTINNDAEFSQFYIYSSAAISFESIAVTYGTPDTYSNYTTTIPVATINITTARYATYVATIDLDFSEADVIAYAVTPDVANDWVTLSPVTTVPAGKAIVVKGTAGEHEVPAAASAEDFQTALEVSATAITAAEGDQYIYYYLGKEGDAVGFRPLNVTGTLAAGKCFFKVVNGGSARFMRIATEGETTGIKTVESAKNNAVVYNLAGQRVAANAKGIVIVNGKKMLNK